MTGEDRPRRGPGRRLAIGALLLLAVLACAPASRAMASAAGELRAIGDSPEGKRLERQLEGEFIAGSEHGAMVRGLRRYGDDLTGLQRGLVQLSIALSSPGYRDLRAGLLQRHPRDAQLRELPSFLELIGRSPALRQLVRKGEWLRGHPAALRRELSVYTLLATDPKSSNLNRRLAEVLSRPDASDFVESISSLRAIALLSPLQVERLPAAAPSRRVLASGSSVGSTCDAAVGLAKKGAARLWNAYERFSVFTWTVTEQVILEGVYLYNRYPPDFKELGLELLKHPTEPVATSGEWALNWALVSSMQQGLTGLAARIQKWISHLQGDVDPLHPDPGNPNQRPWSWRRDGGARASDSSPTEGGSCHPSPEPTHPGPTGGGSEPTGAGGGSGGPGGEGPLHWTGEVHYENHWTESLTYENGEPLQRAGISSATWIVDAYSPESGSEREPGGYSYYYLPYVGSWEQSAREEDRELGCSAFESRSVEGSGSGSPPPTHGFPWREETLIEPPWFFRGWHLFLYSTPLGQKRFSRENCHETSGQTEEPVPYYVEGTFSGGLSEAGTPWNCGMVEVPLSPTLFSSPGRIVGSRGGGSGLCANAVLTWDLTVTCPDGGPPREEPVSLSCGAEPLRRALRSRRRTPGVI